MLSTPLRRLALAAAVPALVLPCLLAGPAEAAGRHGPHRPAAGLPR